MDKESWERGVRDAYRTGIAGLCPPDADPYSYWRGWKDGDAARHGAEVTVDVARICGLVKECK